MRPRRTSTMVRWAAPFLAAATVFVTAASGNAVPRTAPTNVDVSVRHGDEAEDAIAINPTDPHNIVAMSTLTQAKAGLAEGVSFDGGATWTRRVIGTGTPLGRICCDEQLAWDRFGNRTAPESVPTSAGRGDYGDTAVGPAGQVVAIYQDHTSGQGGSRIYTAIDPDGLGPAGFSDPRLLASSRVGGFDYIPAQPDRSVDAEANLAWDRSGGPHDGRLYAVWTQEVKNESDNTDIMFQYSDDAGMSWTPPVRLNDDST